MQWNCLRLLRIGKERIRLPYMIKRKVQKVPNLQCPELLVFQIKM